MGHELTHGFDDRGISFLLHKYPYTAQCNSCARSFVVNEPCGLERPPKSFLS